MYTFGSSVYPQVKYGSLREKCWKPNRQYEKLLWAQYFCEFLSIIIFLFNLLNKHITGFRITGIASQNVTQFLSNAMRSSEKKCFCIAAFAIQKCVFNCVTKAPKKILITRLSIVNNGMTLRGPADHPL